MVIGVAVSPDGRYVAATTSVSQPPFSPDGWLGVWEARSGRLLSSFHLGADGRAVAFSPDAPFLVTAMGNNQAVVFDYIRGRTLRTIKALVHSITGNGTPASVDGLTFFANGDLLMGEDAGVVETWDPRTGRAVQHPIQAEQQAIASLAVLPDQSAFVTTSASGDLKLWDSASLQQFGSTFPGTPGVSSTAAVTPDGKNLVVVYADGSGFVWPLALSAWTNHACAVAHRNLTQEEWSRFVPGHPYQNIC
jgi:WD40 repeat protein